MLSGIQKTLFAVLVAAVASVGCTRKHEAPTFVKIVPAIQTRVTGLHFDTGDCIGLTITRGSGIYTENRMMTYDGTAFTSPGLLWYNDLGEKSTLTAYYPYRAQGVPAEFDIAADQSAGLVSSDLLAAVKTEVTPGAAPVGMVFYHLMSQLSLLVTNNSDAAVSGITISGLVPTAEVDFTVPTAMVKTGAAAAQIEAFEVTANAVYRVLLVPQTADLTVTVSMSDGKRRSKTITAAQLESGKRYDVPVVVTNIDISISLNGDIHDWEEGGSLGGGDGGGNEGDVSSVTYEGVTYRAETIGGQVWMSENLRYMPEGAGIGNGMWYPSKGAQAVPELGMLYNYATASGGAEAAADTPVRGICPPGWHIPDASELTALLESPELSDGFYLCGGFRIIAGINDRYGAETQGYLMGTLSAESGKCNGILFATGQQSKVTLVFATYGLSLRCVKDR